MPGEKREDGDRDRFVEYLKTTERVEYTWAAEAIRRRDEIRSGEVQAVPGEKVLEEVRRLVGR